MFKELNFGYQLEQYLRINMKIVKLICSEYDGDSDDEINKMIDEYDDKYADFDYKDIYNYFLMLNRYNNFVYNNNKNQNGRYLIIQSDIDFEIIDIESILRVSYLKKIDKKHIELTIHNILDVETIIFSFKKYEIEKILVHNKDTLLQYTYHSDQLFKLQ